MRGSVDICPENCVFLEPSGLCLKEARPMTHYHVRWSSGKLDWERFNTRAEAEEGARRLIRQEGTYTVEEFSNTGCPPCRDV